MQTNLKLFLDFFHILSKKRLKTEIKTYSGNQPRIRTQKSLAINDDPSIKYSFGWFVVESGLMNWILKKILAKNAKFYKKNLVSSKYYSNYMQDLILSFFEAVASSRRFKNIVYFCQSVENKKDVHLLCSKLIFLFIKIQQVNVEVYITI